MRCVRGWPRRVGVVLAGLLAAVGQPTRGGQVGAKAAFARAAQLDGRAYVLARSLIVRAGKPALPFLREKAGSAAWRERDLARALILRIEQPAKAHLLDYALLWWKTEFAFRDDGTVAATLPGPVEALAKLQGHIKTVHLKDISEQSHDAHDTIWGTGVCDARGILAELHRQEFTGVISVEYEYNWDDSVPDIAECVAFFNAATDDLFGDA